MPQINVAFALAKLLSSSHGILFNNALKHDGYYVEVDPFQSIDQVVYGFDSDTRRLDKLEIWYAGDTDAYQFGEGHFGIPNYQGPNVNDASVVHWQFRSGDDQVKVIASKGVLEFRLE